MPEGDNDLGMAYEELQDGRFIFGSVDEVAEQIIALAKARPSAPPEVMLASCEEMAEHDVPQLMT